MAIARNISINNETYELEPSKGQRVYVGTCSTAAATNPKVCTVEDFPVDGNGEPYAGTEIVVKFTATNTSTSTTPELNVNGTGAIRIWYNNAVLASAKSAYAGYANRYLHYVYDGTYWVFMGHSVDNNSTYSNVALGQGYAVQNNSAASATITATLGSYALTANGIVSVKFLYDVPANATLNINSKGAKAIYNKDAAITAGVIKSGDTATFIYNTYYHLIAVDSWQDKQDAISDLATIRSGAAAGATALQSYTETDPTVPSWAKASTKPTYTASEVGAVPTTRTVNGKALSNNITLSASDVGALPSNTHIPADQVNSDWDASSGVAQILNKPTFKTINGESIVGTGDIEAGSGDVATAFTITITSTTIEVQPMTGAMMTVGTDVSFQVV